MPRRVAIVATVLLLMLASAGALVVIAQRSCPPPGWAFWLTTEGPDDRVNFGCAGE